MAQVLRFTIRVDDQGTAVVEKFTKGVDDSAKKAKKSAGKMSKAFAGVRKGLGGLSRSVFSLRGLLVGLGAAAIVRSIGRAAFAQEEAVTRVNAALRASGQFSEEASRGLQEFASQLQATTIFGDEVILNQIALAKAFGFSNETVRDAVEAAVELSAAAGIELTEAIRRVGRTISGSTADVQKFAPEIANLTKQQLAAGDAAKVLGEALRGSAAAQAETTRGRMIQLGNALGDVVERIGQSITESDKFRDALKDLAAGINAANSAAGDDKGKLGDVLAKFVPSAQTASLASEIFTKGVEGLAVGFQGLGALTNSAIATTQKIGVNLRIASASARDNTEAVRTLTTQLKFIDLELAKTNKGFKQNAQELFGMEVEQEKATVTASDLTKGIKALNEELDAEIKALQGGAEATKGIVDEIAKLNNITPEAASTFSDFALTVAERIDALPKSLARTREELADILFAPPTFLPTQEATERVIAELDQLEARFARVPSDIGAPLQEGATKILEFLGLVRLSSEETTAAINGIVSSFSAVLAFSTSEAASQFGTLSSQFQQGFGQLNALTEQANKFQEQNTAQRASTIIGITGSLFGSLAALAGEGSRSEFETFKAFAIAEAVVAAALGITRALAEGGPFLGPALAVTMAAQTALQIRKIRSTQFGGGTAPTAPGGGGGAAAVAAPLAPVAPAAPAEAAMPETPTQISISVSGFIGDEAELASVLGDIISEAQEDDVDFQIST